MTDNSMPWTEQANASQGVLAWLEAVGSEIRDEIVRRRVGARIDHRLCY
jgi:hypothetical protein